MLKIRQLWLASSGVALLWLGWRAYRTWGIFRLMQVASGVNPDAVHYVEATLLLAWVIPLIAVLGLVCIETWTLKSGTEDGQSGGRGLTR